MTKILSGLPLFLLLSAAQAQLAKADPPVDESNLVGTIVFIILFVAACAGFAWFVYRNEQKSKQKKELPGSGSSTKA